MMNNISSLLQEHTRKIYNLDNKKYQVKNIAACELLNISRFDLFAKLLYIKYRSVNFDFANKIYSEHIKVFNPNLKEPGRDDKKNLNDFQYTFDKIILEFSTKEFDNSISIIPVDKNGVILDGAHRVAALAFYGKMVTIAQFEDVESKGIFDYNYFINRGLSIETADRIALEAINWCENIYTVCLRSDIFNSKKRSLLQEYLKQKNLILYEKTILVSLTSLLRFTAKLYTHKGWWRKKDNDYKCDANIASNCHLFGKRFDIFFFQISLPLDDIKDIETEIRQYFHNMEYAIHISNDVVETEQISTLVLDDEDRIRWLCSKRLKLLNFIYNKSKNTIHLLNFYYWIPLKTYIYQLIHSFLPYR